MTLEKKLACEDALMKLRYQINFKIDTALDESDYNMIYGLIACDLIEYKDTVNKIVTGGN